MRLHLDPNNAPESASGANANQQLSQTGKSTGSAGASGIGFTPSGSGSPDSVAVSDASSAWASSFSDRTGRVSQLAAAVQNGTYRVSGAALAQSIVASAFA